MTIFPCFRCQFLLSRSLFLTSNRCWSLKSQFGQFVIPRVPGPSVGWNSTNFHQFRQRFGEMLEVDAFLLVKMKKLIEEAELAGKSVSFPNFFALSKEAKNIFDRPDVKEKLMKNQGFCLMESPFYVPSDNSSFWTRFQSNWGIFKLKRLDPTFDFGQFFQILPQIFEMISQKLYKKNFNSLKGLIEAETLDQLSENVSKLDEKRLQLLNLTENDIYKLDKTKSAPPHVHGGPSVDVVKVNFTKNTVNLLVFYIGVYKYSIINSKWPEIPPDYGFDTPKVIFGNFVFTKRIKPEVDADWSISNLNYIAVP